jgi:hypothetical protein
MRKLTKDQIQKIGLSLVGFVLLFYIYTNYFLGPLTRSRNTMLASIADKQAKLSSAKTHLSRASSLETEAKSATTRYAALKSFSPEGAPIAWFPPRMKVFFANQQIDKASARLESSAPFKEPELAAWTRHTWLIDLPQADYMTIGKAISQLENAEPLMAVSRLSIRVLNDQPQFQQTSLTVINYIPKNETAKR